MKILQLTTVLSLAGAEQIILDLCSMPEHTFVIAGLQDGDGTLRTAAETRGLPVASMNMRGKLDVTVLHRLRRFVREGGFDLIHTHLPHANAVGRVIGSATGIPVISTVHNVERRVRPDHASLEWLTGRLPYRITVVSEAVRQHVVRSWRLPADRVVVVPNGIDTDRFSFGDEPRDVDFLFLGRLTRQKGVDLVIPSLAPVCADTGGRLTIVGSGPEEGRLRELAEEHHVPVRWEPFTQEPESWLRRTRICLMPSRWEGFGLVAAEAMACGAVVVHSGVDALPDVCGPYGLTLPPDREEWPHFITTAWRSFVVNGPGREWVRERFSKDRMVNDFARLYDAAGSAGP